MHTDITEENKNLLKDYTETFQNGTINFIDMSSFIQNEDLESLMSSRKEYNYISPETYFRFYIPKILKNYDKVIYLDADILVLTVVEVGHQVSMRQVHVHVISV